MINVSCITTILFTSGILEEYKYNRELAEDRKDYIEIINLDNRFYQVNKKVAKLCETKGEK